MTFTPNRNYNNQLTGGNIGTWGLVLNSNFSTIDLNLGGTNNISVAGNSNVNVTVPQAQNLIHNLTGALTGNINYNFPAQGGFFLISNQTTGNFSVTVTVQGGSGGVLIPQGTNATVYIDATVPQVESFVGTQYIYSAPTVGGTPNAITIASTLPVSFTLSTGTLLTVTPSTYNTASTTLQTPDTNVKTIKKISETGLVNLQPEDLAPNVPVVLQYNGTYWIAISLPLYNPPVSQAGNFTVGTSSVGQAQLCTATLVATLSSAATLPADFYTEIHAIGGSVTITPNAADSITAYGTQLANGASFILPQGAGCKLFTDTTGKWFIGFIGHKLNYEATVASATTTDLGASGSNICLITGTTAITSFGSSAFPGNPLYFIRFNNILTLTNSANIILPGAANITTAAGDTAIAKYEGSGIWRVIAYQFYSGFGSAKGFQSFTSAGEYTFTVSANVTPTTLFEFIVTGAGAAGGGPNGGGSAGSGGGAGSTGIYSVTGLTPGQTCSVTVGAGGIGVVNGAGNNGGASSVVVGATTVTAPGGSGGPRGGNPATSGGLGGGNTTNATMNIPGGGGATAVANGTAAYNSGQGGASYWGGGGYAVGGANIGNGNNGQAPGSGGSGGIGNGGQSGGNGADGAIVIRWC